MGSAIAVGVLAGPVAALDAVPQDEAEPFVAGDGTEVYCIFDIDPNEDNATTAFQFADCAAVFEGLTSSDEADDEEAGAEDASTLRSPGSEVTLGRWTFSIESVDDSAWKRIKKREPVQ